MTFVVLVCDALINILGFGMVICFVVVLVWSVVLSYFGLLEFRIRRFLGIYCELWFPLQVEG